MLCKNTDREIWREKEGDYYSPSIHVTENGHIGINVGGHVIVMSVHEWHLLPGLEKFRAKPEFPSVYLMLFGFVVGFIGGLMLGFMR